MQFRIPAVLACLSALAACAQQPAATTSADPAAAQPRQAAAEPGMERAARARVCDAPNIGRLTSATITMTLSNEGGWCTKVLDRRGMGFTGGNVVDQPSHGEARLRHTPNRSFVDYRPRPGYVGEDRFSVVVTPGNITFPVSATVRP